jgi:hypothetical protein
MKTYKDFMIESAKLSKPKLSVPSALNPKTIFKKATNKSASAGKKLGTMIGKKIAASIGL